jgi:hypothetical protein
METRYGRRRVTVSTATTGESRIMSEFTLPSWLKVIGWLSTMAMSVAAIVIFAIWPAREPGEPVMAPKISWVITAVAAALLLSAIVIIRLAQWLYNHRLISFRTAEHFFAAAKHLEQKADRRAKQLRD